MYWRNLGLLVTGVALLGTAACATSEEWADWQAHSAQYASVGHFVFSMKNQSAPPLNQSPQDVALAKKEGWWGGPFLDGPFANVAGHWTGRWSGFGVYNFPFSSYAEVDLVQHGRLGRGRLVMEDTLTMDVPEIMTIEGNHGVRVLMKVSGSKVLLQHEAGGRWLTGEFTVEGDRMTGHLKDTSAKLVLVRQK